MEIEIFIIKYGFKVNLTYQKNEKFYKTCIKVNQIIKEFYGIQKKSRI